MSFTLNTKMFIKLILHSYWLCLLFTSPSGTQFIWYHITAGLQRYLPGNLVYHPAIQDMLTPLHRFYFIKLPRNIYIYIFHKGCGTQGA